MINPGRPESDRPTRAHGTTSETTPEEPEEESASGRSTGRRITNIAYLGNIL